MLCTAVFLVGAALEFVEFVEPVQDCVLPSPLPALLWLCVALGFAGAGLSKRRLRGAALGAESVLVPVTLFMLLTEVFTSNRGLLGFVPFVAIMAAVVYNAIVQTIRGQ